MLSNASRNAMANKPWPQRLGYALAAIWIFGGMFVFFIRFSAKFYQANQPAIDALIARIADAVGLGS